MKRRTERTEERRDRELAELGLQSIREHSICTKDREQGDKEHAQDNSKTEIITLGMGYFCRSGMAF